jgi:CCR4-NOT transcription complex subunit 1
VTIAGVSTRELVAKDFALEQDEEKMRKAAHLMVQYLAGNLALVTRKEPLRNNMVTHVRHLLTEQGYTEVNLPAFVQASRASVLYLILSFLQQVVLEQGIMLIVADNVDIACAAIEKAAKECAVADVDEAFILAYNDRRIHREVSSIRFISICFLF